MADTPTFQSNPYGSFDPSQWTNPYSNFYGRALPFPPSYAGTPTNALGQPIQSPQAPQAPQGMTLNSTPAQPQAPGAANPFANVPNVQGQNAPATEPRGGLNIADWQALSPAQRSAAMGPMGQYSAGLAMMPSGNNFVASGSNPSGANPQASTALGFMNSGLNGFAQMQQQAQQGAGPSAPGPPNNWQNTLSMLANPGHVTTPGATIPMAPQGSAQPGPGVLQNFLANWQPAQSGPGSGFTQNFNTILRGLQAQKGS
jgi:hypothetical protein